LAVLIETLIGISTGQNFVEEGVVDRVFTPLGWPKKPFNMFTDLSGFVETMHTADLTEKLAVCFFVTFCILRRSLISSRGFLLK
jgi:hypothetical protein